MNMTTLRFIATAAVILTCAMIITIALAYLCTGALETMNNTPDVNVIIGVPVEMI